MAPKNEYVPESIAHPGELLEEKLEEMGMSVKEFALRTDKPGKTIIAVLKGNSSITTEMALKFEKVTRIPMDYWLRHQMLFDEYKTRLNFVSVIEEAEDWAENFPYSELVKHYGLPTARKSEEKTQNLFHFFGIASNHAWENLYMKSELKVAAYTSLKHTHEPHATSAWLRQGELQAEKIQVGEFNKAEFKNILPKIKTIMATHPTDFFIQLQNFCMQAGVKLVFTPMLPKVPISGSTRWLNNTPLIQMTARYKQNDRFWFTFFHEAGHILLHGKKYISLENLDFSDADPVKEQEANSFAEEWCFAKAHEQALMQRKPIEIEDILEFAKKDNTHPAMIIGRLQHKKQLHFSQGRDFFIPITIDELL